MLEPIVLSEGPLRVVVEPNGRRSAFHLWSANARLVLDRGDLTSATTRERVLKAALADAEARGLEIDGSAIDRLLTNAAAKALVVEKQAIGENGVEPAPEQGTEIALADVEPWPDPVDGDELLRELVRTISRHVALPEGGATGIALWTLHVHAHDAADISPILALASAEKRSGKTTTLEILAALVPRALPTSSISTAALFRAVEKFAPTLLIDEADTALDRNDELRSIVNSGHTRATAFVVRAVGEDFEPRIFRTWGPKAIALIGKLPGTVEDRAILIRMRRKRPDETVKRLRRSTLVTELESLRRRSARWAADSIANLRTADPIVPNQLHDRAADNWRPLLAMADLIGGTWPERARKAALTLQGDAEDDDSAGVKLLADIRKIFTEKTTERIPSRDLADALAELEDRPWPEWRRGSPLTPTSMARLLKPFGISPKQLRIDGDKARGYELADFEDVFARYLPVETVHPVQSSDDAGNGASANRYTGDNRTGSKSAENPHRSCDVPPVPVQNPDPVESGDASDVTDHTQQVTRWY